MRSWTPIPCGQQIPVVVDFESVVDIEILEHAAYRRMLDLLMIVHQFNARVGDAGAVLEKRRKTPAGDIAILIDGRGQNSSAVLAKPHRIIGATSEKDMRKGVRLIIILHVLPRVVSPYTLAYCPALIIV